MNAPTLTALLEANRSVKRSIVHLESERGKRTVSFSELHRRALGILYRLQNLGARAGDKLILLLSGNEPFLDAFWAGVLGGIVPVPVAVGISDEHRYKLLRIVRKLGAPYIYTESRLLERVGVFAAQCGESKLFEQLRARAFLLDELDDISQAGQPYRARPEDVAFIQFSSGSTSEPKGVVLTHANLMANIGAMNQGAATSERDVSLSWMPLTHDMGLIGFHLATFASRGHAYLMPTDLFIRRPLIWLQFASRIGATVLSSPNFGYQHYLKALGERAPADLQLSNVRLIVNGAEPISVELCEEFLTRLAPAGLKRNAMFPVYGLAEASLAVSFPAPGAPYQVSAFDRHRLSVGAEVALLERDARDALALVGVGRAVARCELRIADDADQALPPEHVGHILIRGANVTSGYFQDPELNAQSFAADGWLRTGDLGVLHAEQLYITGRQKEILFVHGQNYYPYDLERILEDLDGLEMGKVAVAGIRAPQARTDDVVVFVQYRDELPKFLGVALQIARRLALQVGLQVSAVVPVRRIPKTTSGKIQRHLLEQEYLAGAFNTELEELTRLRTAAPEMQHCGGQIERQLQGLCETVLEGRHIDVNQSLFDIGANSVKLIALHEQIERQWPGLVDITDIFDHPTIADLADLIERKRHSGGAA